MVGLHVVRVYCWHQCQMTYKYDLMFENKKKLIFILVLLIIIKCMNANPGQRKRNKLFCWSLCVWCVELIESRLLCEFYKRNLSAVQMMNICKMIQNLRVVTLIRWYLREVESSWHCGPDIPMLRSGFATPNVLNNRWPGKPGERNTPHTLHHSQD